MSSVFELLFDTYGDHLMQEQAPYDEAEILAAISEERADVEIMLNQLHVIFGDNTDMEIAKLEHLCELLGE